MEAGYGLAVALGKGFLYPKTLHMAVFLYIFKTWAFGLWQVFYARRIPDRKILQNI